MFSEYMERAWWETTVSVYSASEIHRFCRMFLYSSNTTGSSSNTLRSGQNIWWYQYKNSFVNTIRPCHDRPPRDIESPAHTLSRRAWGLVRHSLHSKLFFLLSVDDSFLLENSLSREKVHQDCSVCLLTVLAKY
jgi:hypothetical protein